MRSVRRRNGPAPGTSRSPAPSGRMTRSQSVSTFGVGAIYELRFSVGNEQVLNSVIIAGLDDWHADECALIHEPVLQRALGVNYFRLPPGVPDNNAPPNPEQCIPAFRFPAWMVCSGCQTLGRAPREFDDQRSSKPQCRKDSCRGRGIPVRLVTSCHSRDGDSSYHPGHVDEFPWEWWAHNLQKICDKPRLELLATGTSAGLSGLTVRCTSCRSENSLAGVFSESALKNRACRGKRPWLSDEEECDRPARALMRGASNMYFPVVASAITIPPYSKKLLSTLTSNPAVMGSIEKVDLDVLLGVVINDPKLKKHYSKEQVLDGLKQLKDESRIDTPLTEKEQKAAERRALGLGTAKFEGEGEFKVRIVPEQEYRHFDLSSFIDCLGQVDRLREVRALRGFSRVSPISSGDPYTISCAPLSKNVTEWLPALEVNGEGIYFELSPDDLLEWCQREAVIRRHARIEQRWKDSEAGNQDCPTPAFILVHTLTHMLINQLSLDCGYSSASLRERIYVQGGLDGWAGALIYTAVPGADGTLGGLVSQGAPEAFMNTMKKAVDTSMWCSSDPLCIDLEGQGAGALNQAACHACCLVSETSCEEANSLLDRAYICGTDEHPELSFFNARARDA